MTRYKYVASQGKIPLTEAEELIQDQIEQEYEDKAVERKQEEVYNICIQAYLDKLAEGLEFTSAYLTCKIDVKHFDQNNIANKLTWIESTGNTDDVTFRDYDNVNHTLTVVQFKEVCEAIGNYCYDLLLQSWQYKDSITDAETVEDLEAIESTGFFSS